MSSGDQPTGGLHIFIRMLSRYVREVDPYSVVVCWDGGRSAARSKLYPGYKAARSEHHESSRSQFSLIKEFLALANIYHVEVPGVEGDDLVAAYWKRKASDERVVILSGDKDFLQLLDGWTEQIRPAGGRDEDERWTTNRVRTEMKCQPQHLPYYMALVGDTTDGIPGVAGYGPKKALAALAKYQWDFEAMLAGEPKLFNSRDEARVFLQLVSLREIDILVPEPPKFEPTDLTNMMADELRSFFDRYRLAATKTRWIEGTLWRESVKQEA